MSQRRHADARRPRIAQRRGFTIVELLVVITIIGLLMAMTFPALQGVLAQVRRQTCANKLRDLANACEVFASNPPDRYPALVDKGQMVRGVTKQPLPWTVKVLAYLGQKPLGDTWTSPSPGKAYVVTRVSAFICPEDTTAETGDQPLSFVINAGATEDAMKVTAANGIAFSRYVDGVGTSRSQINNDKSLAATILLTENLQAGNWGDKRKNIDVPTPYDGESPTSAREVQRYTGFVWNGLGINQGDEEHDFDDPGALPEAKWARPSSEHPGGVNIAMCAGVVRFLDQGIDRHVFQYLCVANPAKAAAKGLEPRVATMVSAPEF